MEYVFLALIWGLYFTLHSVLASNGVKNYFKRRFSAFYPYYRIFYNLIALFLLMPIHIFQKSILPVMLFNTGVLVSVLGGVVMLGGMVFGALAFRNYSGKEFIGLDFQNENIGLKKGKLNVSGLNKYVRHPLYFATLLIIWGYFLIRPTLLVLVINCVISVYLVVGTKFEEKKLIAEFGEQYVRYKKRVPMLIPFFSPLLTFFILHYCC